MKIAGIIIALIGFVASAVLARGEPVLAGITFAVCFVVLIIALDMKDRDDDY